jgi:hypothetical protein
VHHSLAAIAEIVPDFVRNASRSAFSFAAIWRDLPGFTGIGSTADLVETVVGTRPTIATHTVAVR